MSFAGKLRRTIAKKAGGTVHEGFYDKEQWIPSGNYAVDRMLSGTYGKGIPYGKTVVIGGQSGSGKSLLAATALAEAQKLGAIGVWLDAEKASRRQWLSDIGVDTSEDKLVYLEVATVEDVKSIVSSISAEMRAQKEEDRTPIYLVIDSYSFLMTETQMENAVKGEIVGDQGQHAKQLKDLVKSATHLITRLPFVVVGVVHTMASTDKYNPDEILLGGRGIEFAASLVIVMNKMKLKMEHMEKEGSQHIESVSAMYTDEDLGKKVLGIRCKIQIYKSRFAKPNESVNVQIPYPKGIDRLSGLFDQMVSEGIITSPTVGWYTYGEGKSKFRRKDFPDHADVIMASATTGRQIVQAPVAAEVGEGEEA